MNFYTPRGGFFGAFFQQKPRQLNDKAVMVFVNLKKRGVFSTNNFHPSLLSKGGKLFCGFCAMEYWLKRQLVNTCYPKPPKLRCLGYDRKRQRYIWRYDFLGTKFRHNVIPQPKPNPIYKILDNILKTHFMDNPPGLPGFFQFKRLFHRRRR